jgi:hypothetical protein
VLRAPRPGCPDTMFQHDARFPRPRLSATTERMIPCNSWNRRVPIPNTVLKEFGSQLGGLTCDTVRLATGTPRATIMMVR